MALRETSEAGVEGNARLTGLTAVALLVALAVEGFTVLDVQNFIVLHMFVGLFLVPVTVLKLASTGWRFLRYYRGDAGYERKGPPKKLLRILAPLVVLSSVALLGTGVALIIIGPNRWRNLKDIHQASFIVWVVLMTVHVLGHILETWHLSKADVTQAEPKTPGRGKRFGLVGLSLLVGLALGVGSLTWNSAWKNRVNDRGNEGRPPRGQVKP
jgi:hypothetical protein